MGYSTHAKIPPDSHTPICLEWTIPPRSHGLCDISHRQSDHLTLKAHM